MSLRLEVPGGASARIRAHLARQAEMVAFLQGTIDGATVTTHAELLLGPAQVELNRWHVALTDEARRKVLQWATGAEALVEAHSHGALAGPARFSSTDLDALREWVPHVRWRVPRVTYLALVYGDDSFDGLVWQSDHMPSQLGEVALEGEGTWQATGLSLQRWNRRQSDV
jgi:Prokaryotic homologs of the JAB domain